MNRVNLNWHTSWRREGGGAIMISRSRGARRAFLFVVVGAALVIGASPVVAQAGRISRVGARHRPFSGSTLTVVLLGGQPPVLTRPGATVKLNAEVTKGSVVVTSAKISWSSSDPSAVSVSSSGLVTARVSPGSATIAITSPGADGAVADIAVAPAAPDTVVVASGDVVSNSTSKGTTTSTLVSNPTTDAIRVGDRVVSGSAGGLLAYVHTTARSGSHVVLTTTPSSLDHAFTQLDINVGGSARSATLDVKAGAASVVLPGGRVVAQLPAAETFTCTNDVPGDEPVQLSGANLTAPVTFQSIARLQSTTAGIQLFELGVHVSIPVSVLTGAVLVNTPGEVDSTCSTVLSQVEAASPVWIGPVEVAPTIVESNGIEVSGYTSSEPLGLTGPAMTADFTTSYGVEWTHAEGWEPIGIGPFASPTMAGPAITSAQSLELHVYPFVAADVRVSASLAGVLSVTSLGFADGQAEGFANLMFSAPFDDLDKAYGGPNWNTNVTFSAGPTIDVASVASLIELFGAPVTSTDFNEPEKNFETVASPAITVTAASGTVKVGAGDLITATVGGGFSGDKVELVGFAGSASVGQVIATATAGTDTAAATWRPTSSQEGTWSITALLFPPGASPQPYAAITLAGVTVVAA
jgi:hypothetical protein